MHYRETHKSPLPASFLHSLWLWFLPIRLLGKICRHRRRHRYHHHHHFYYQYMMYRMSWVEMSPWVEENFISFTLLFFIVTEFGWTDSFCEGSASKVLFTKLRKRKHLKWRGSLRNLHIFLWIIICSDIKWEKLGETLPDAKIITQFNRIHFRLQEKKRRRISRVNFGRNSKFH